MKKMWNLEGEFCNLATKKKKKKGKRIVCMIYFLLYFKGENVGCFHTH